MATDIQQADERLKVGAYLVFKGYAQETPNPLLQQGELLQVESYDLQDGLTVKAFRPELAEKRETVFEDEVQWPSEDELASLTSAAGIAADEQPATESALAASDEPEAEEPSTPAKAKGKGKGKAKAETAKPKKAKASASAAIEESDTAVSEGGVSAPGHLTIANNTRAVSEIIQGDGDAILDSAADLNNRVEETYFTLGGVLSHIYSEGLYKRRGYDGKRAFATFCKEEVGIDYRKAMYLIEIYQSFSKLGIPEDRLAEIGWSKVKELVKVDDREKALEYLDYAKSHTRSELSDYIRTERVEGGDGSSDTRVRMTTFNFKVTEEAAVNIQAALDRAKNMAGTETLSGCFEFIVSEWRTMQEGIEVPKEEAIAVLEQRYGIRLAEVDEAEASDSGVEEATATAGA